MPSLNRFLALRKIVLDARRRWLGLARGTRIAPSARISLQASLVTGERGAITVGEETLVAFKTLLIARQPDGVVKPIRIGRRCFIGGGSTILPGVTIGDEAVVGAGSIVREDVPSRCIVAGNPARILSENIEVGPYGRFTYADENQKKYYHPD